MALKKFSKSHHGTMHELNITPLLDLAFVLLVIFIITTAPMVNDLDLNLPTPSASTNAPPARPHLLTVESDGSIVLDGAGFELAALQRKLGSLQREDPRTTVVLFSEGAARYQRVIDVLDALQQNSVTNVGLASERPRAGGTPRL